MNETDLVPAESQLSIPSFLYRDNIPPYQERMLQMYREFHQYVIARGRVDDTFGFPLLTEGVEGVQPGFYIVMGAPNMGKSAFMSHLAWNIAHENDNYYVIYIALDDNSVEIIPRFCAIHTRHPMNRFSMPMRFALSDEEVRIYYQGLQGLADSVDRLYIVDQSHGDQIETIQSLIAKKGDELAEHDPGRKMAVFIDSFHDLKTKRKDLMKEKNDRYEFIAEYIKNLAKSWRIPIICTAEIKKTGGIRRPVLEDLRESGNIVYEAQLVWGIFNDVSARKESAQVYFRNREDGGPKLPVLEVDFLKNKLSSFKGRLFYHFFPERSFLLEASQEAQQYYETMLRS